VSHAETQVSVCVPKLLQGKGGGSNMAALELVAMDMKAQGMYVCRTLSFAGGWRGGMVGGDALAGLEGRASVFRYT